jgi:hypothetical protein
MNPLLLTGEKKPEFDEAEGVIPSPSKNMRRKRTSAQTPVSGGTHYPFQEDERDIQ